MTKAVQIPPGWRAERLASVASIVTGSTPPTSVRAYYGHDRMFVSPADLGGSKYVLRTQKHLSRTGFARSRRLPPGSTLFVCIGSTIGKVGLARDDLATNQQINALIPLPGVDAEYLYYAATTLSSTVRNRAGEQAVPLVNKSEFSEFTVLVPPAPEQRRIAGVLADVDDLVVSLGRLITKKQAIKRGMMQELITGKTRLPGFTGKWTEQQLGSLGSTYGGLIGKTKDDFGVGAGQYVPFMAVMSDVQVRPQSLLSVRVAAGERQNVVRSGDLLFNTSSETPDELAMCSVAGELPENTYLNSFCFGFRLSTPMTADALFLAYMFRSEVGRRLMDSLAQGATRYNLSKSQFRKLTLTLPPANEQRMIASVLRETDIELEVLDKRLAKVQAIKLGMMQELLTGRTRLPVAEAVA